MTYAVAQESMASPIPPMPEIGMTTMVRGHRCRIVAVYPKERTIDVVSLDGEHGWRVSGMRFDCE